MTPQWKRFCWLMLFGSAIPALALGQSAPTYIPVQGFLAADDGTPRDGAFTMEFRLYQENEGGVAFYAESQEVTLDNGLLTVYLGDGSPADLGDGTTSPTLELSLFVGRPQGVVFLGVTIGDDPELAPRLQLGSVPFAAFAQTCGDAFTLGGVPVSELATADDVISAVTAGTGLTGGGSSGDVTLGLGEHSADLLTSGTVPSARLSGTYAISISGNAATADSSTTATVAEALSTDPAACISGRYVTDMAADGTLTCETPAGDHGSLSGRGDDDHTQYALLAGRGSGQTLHGGTAASGTLTLESTSSSTKGNVVLNPSGGNVGIGTSSPTTRLHVAGAGSGLNNAAVIAENFSAGGYGLVGNGYEAGVVGQAAAIRATGWNTGVRGVGGYSEEWNIGVFGAGGGDQGTRVGVFGQGTDYDFYADSGTGGTDYGPFTGGHDVIYRGTVSKLKRGMILSSTGETKLRETMDGERSISSTLPTVVLSEKAYDKRVLGVFVGTITPPEDPWYRLQPGEALAIANALGEGRVYVSDANGEIQAGDYVTTSNIPGYGQRQDDDLLHNYTLGKATEDVDWDTVTETITHRDREYKVYLIAVTYTSG